MENVIQDDVINACEQLQANRKNIQILHLKYVYQIPLAVGDTVEVF